MDSVLKLDADGSVSVRLTLEQLKAADGTVCVRLNAVHDSVIVLPTAAEPNSEKQVPSWQLGPRAVAQGWWNEPL